MKSVLRSIPIVQPVIRFSQTGVYNIPSNEEYKIRCAEAYRKIEEENPKIDAGHSVNHVKMVENLTSEALGELLEMIYNGVHRGKSNSDLTSWLANHPIESLNTPQDVNLRVSVASLLHEVGDRKTIKDGSKTPKADIIAVILNEIFNDYPYYSEEMADDIINMVDLCSASKWGDRIPEETKLYQLLPRWADRQEATGMIGIIRCLLYSFSKMDKGFQLLP